MALDPVRVAGYAAKAGWRGGDLVIATALAYAESGGNPDKAGGLWNVAGAPADAGGQASQAYGRWQSGGWRQWAGFSSGKYLLFMPIAGPAAAAVDVAVVAGGATGGAALGIGEAAKNLPGGDLVSAAQNALTLGYKAGAWIADRNNWLRVAEVIIGGGLIIGALVIVSKPITGPIVSTVAGVAKKAATRGAA